MQMEFVRHIAISRANDCNWLVISKDELYVAAVPSFQWADDSDFENLLRRALAEPFPQNI